MNLHDTVELDIQYVTPQGIGVATANGQLVRVTDAKIDDARVQARITDVGVFVHEAVRTGRVAVAHTEAEDLDEGEYEDAEDEQ